MGFFSEKIRAVMGPGCRIDYRFVDDIPLTSSGKHPYVVNKWSASPYAPARTGVAAPIPAGAGRAGATLEAAAQAE